MTSCITRSSLVYVVLGFGLGGCFSEAPTAAAGTSGGPVGTDDTSTTGSLDATTDVPTGGSGTLAPTDSSATDSSSTGGGDSGSTGTDGTTTSSEGSSTSGDTEVAPSCEDAPLQVECFEPRRIAVGAFHACTIGDDEALYCWGQNDFGQRGSADGQDTLGDDEPVGAIEPVDLGGTPVSVVAGRLHTCVLLAGGDVRCFGHNPLGSCGYPDEDDRVGDTEVPADLSPVELSIVPVQIVAGNFHTCVLSADGQVQCWGNNTNGQLGVLGEEQVGDDEVPSTFEPIAFDEPAVQIAAGGDGTCALLQSGDVQCWGANNAGQLGLGNTTSYADVAPPQIPSLDLDGAIIDVQLRAAGGCARRESGTIACWGNGSAPNGYGEVTNIGPDEAPGDAVVPVGGAVQTLIGGSSSLHHCALLSTGDLRCWGANADGQLGLGDIGSVGDDEAPEDTDPVAGQAALEVSLGRHNTCTRVVGGVQCWGLGTSGVTGAGTGQTVFDAASALILPL